jgi:hypothetical protein
VTPAALSIIFLAVQAFVLGSASVLVWRLSANRVLAWLPGLTTLGYYLVCLRWPPPSVRSLRTNEAYTLPDALRYGLLVLAFALCVGLLARLVWRRDRQIRVLQAQLAGRSRGPS